MYRLCPQVKYLRMVKVFKKIRLCIFYRRALQHIISVLQTPAMRDARVRETVSQKRKRALAAMKRLMPLYGLTATGKVGKRNPFRSLIATVLSHRTRDENTETASTRLLARFPTPKAMASAKASQIHPLIKEVGFWRVKAQRVIEIARILVKEFSGRVPDTYEGLLSLPGVGRKTAGCVLVFGFGKQALPVDTHVHRISNRLGLVKTKTPEQTEEALLKVFPSDKLAPVNGVLVEHGKAVCRPISPRCNECTIHGLCPRIDVKRHR
jgi:endonuclease-3